MLKPHLAARTALVCVHLRPYEIERLLVEIARPRLLLDDAVLDHDGSPSTDDQLELEGSKFFVLHGDTPEQFQRQTAVMETEQLPRHVATADATGRLAAKLLFLHSL